MSIPDPLAMLALGVLAGGIGALLGVGGGVILVPALTLGFDLPMREAVAASLVGVTATSVASSIVHLRRRRVHLPMAIEFQFFAVAGAVGAGLIAVYVPAPPLKFAFAMLLVYAAWQMLPTGSQPLHDVPFDYVRPRRTFAAAGALGGGVMSGLLGVGGGIVFVPLLHLLMRRSFIRATATSVYMIGVTAASGAAVYLARGDVGVATAAPLVVGVLGGGALAATLAHRINARPLRILFAVLLLYVAARMVLRGFTQL